MNNLSEEQEKKLKIIVLVVGGIILLGMAIFFKVKLDQKNEIEAQLAELEANDSKETLQENVPEKSNNNIEEIEESLEMLTQETSATSTFEEAKVVMQDEQQTQQNQVVEKYATDLIDEDKYEVKVVNLYPNAKKESSKLYKAEKEREKERYEAGLVDGEYVPIIGKSDTPNTYSIKSEQDVRIITRAEKIEIARTKNPNEIIRVASEKYYMTLDEKQYKKSAIILSKSKKAIVDDVDKTIENAYTAIRIVNKYETSNAAYNITLSESELAQILDELCTDSYVSSLNIENALKKKIEEKSPKYDYNEEEMAEAFLKVFTELFSNLITIES